MNFEFATIFKDARIRKNISLEKLGEKVYRSHQQLSRIERGLAGCDISLAVDILKNLDMDILIVNKKNSINEMGEINMDKITNKKKISSLARIFFYFFNQELFISFYFII